MSRLVNLTTLACLTDVAAGLSIRSARTHDHRRQVRDERGLIAD
jgi:hypothetical protein